MQRSCTNKVRRDNQSVSYAILNSDNTIYATCNIDRESHEMRFLSPSFAFLRLQTRFPGRVLPTTSVFKGEHFYFEETPRHVKNLIRTYLVSGLKQERYPELFERLSLGCIKRNTKLNEKNSSSSEYFFFAKFSAQLTLLSQISLSEFCQQ